MNVAVPEDRGGYDEPESAGARWPLVAAAVIALGGAALAAQSTYDFAQHLDRQVHSIHCSFIPGAGAELGESGCRTVMLSPYSSFFRTSMWGGIPVSLWALAVWAYLAFKAGQLALRRSVTKRETLFLVAAFGLPLLMTVIYGWLSLAKVEATCKVCVGLYVASVLGFGAAVLAHVKAAAADDDGASPAGLWGAWFAQGVAYVGVLTIVWVLLAPKEAASDKGCGTLVQEGDPAKVLVPLAGKPGGTPAIEVLDPLCPSCRAFANRLHASGFEEKLELKAVLFPLDSSCNWMVTDALHPGACAVSEAILCAGPLSKDDAAAQQRNVNAILGWAFEHQEALRAEAKADEKAFRAKIEGKFPAVKGCLGTSLARNKLVKSLRWGVANAIPVLTPQLFVGKTRVCDEDTDLGLEYTLARIADGKYRVAEQVPAKGGKR